MTNSLLFLSSPVPSFRANSVPSSQTLVSHAVGTTPRSRHQQQISTSYAQQAGPNAMYVLYEQQGHKNHSCGSAMDVCESPCQSSQTVLSLKGNWAATSSSSSSLTSPPHSMSPSNYTLPPVASSSSKMRTSSSSHQLVNCSNNLINNNNSNSSQVVSLLLDTKTPPQLLHAMGLSSSAFIDRRTSSGSSGEGSGGQLIP